jgi:hypothetical protein
MSVSAFSLEGFAFPLAPMFAGHGSKEPSVNRRNQDLCDHSRHYLQLWRLAA